MTHCPACGSEAVYCLSNRSTKYRRRGHGRGVLRWYQCSACRRRTMTFEYPVVEPYDVLQVELLAKEVA